MEIPRLYSAPPPPFPLRLRELEHRSGILGFIGSMKAFSQNVLVSDLNASVGKWEPRPHATHFFLSRLEATGYIEAASTAYPPHEYRVTDDPKLLADLQAWYGRESRAAFDAFRKYQKKAWKPELKIWKLQHRSQVLNHIYISRDKTVPRKHLFEVGRHPAWMPSATKAFLENLETSGYIKSVGTDPSVREYRLTDDPKLLAEFKKKCEQAQNAAWAASRKLSDKEMRKAPPDTYFNKVSEVVRKLETAKPNEIPALVEEARADLFITKSFTKNPVVKKRLELLKAKLSHYRQPAGTTSGNPRAKSAGK